MFQNKRHTKVCVTTKYETFTGDYAFGWSLQIPAVWRDKHSEAIRTNFSSQGHFYFELTVLGQRRKWCEIPKLPKHWVLIRHISDNNIHY